MRNMRYVHVVTNEDKLWNFREGVTNAETPVVFEAQFCGEQTNLKSFSRSVPSDKAPKDISRI